MRRAPRVAILATGDELVEPGTKPGPGQIVVLQPLWPRRAGRSASAARRRLLGIAGDTREDLQAKLATAADADVLVTIGGASVGDHDLVEPVLEARGMALDFWKIAMRPGKPMMFGRLERPARAGAAGQPALLPDRGAHLPGAADLPPARTHRCAAARAAAVLAHPLEANGPRQHYMRATLSPGAAGLPPVTALTTQDSAQMSALAAADVLIVRPPNAPAAPAGEVVRVLPLDF